MLSEVIVIGHYCISNTLFTFENNNFIFTVNSNLSNLILCCFESYYKLFC